MSKVIKSKDYNTLAMTETLALSDAAPDARDDEMKSLAAVIKISFSTNNYCILNRNYSKLYPGMLSHPFR